MSNPVSFTQLQRIARALPCVPFKGIEKFYDIQGLLSKPDDFQEAICLLEAKSRSLRPTAIVGIDARGFLLAAPIALRLGVPMVMARKAGKMPGCSHRSTYAKEYETGDTMEIQDGALKEGDRVIIMDDLLATGGTMRAAASLVEEAGAKAVGCLCIVELDALKGRETLSSPEREVWAMVNQAVLDSIVKD
ncbi:hypothetical protein FOZ61_006743 [Perkinsus olseni]|uniref:adenine phosphoribosyltransferase n=1 Tax=Perkinsus olseni TaxID=32597 RepID=A0A7J6LBQ1_PEROL|nr:hypothetical protein FOZ61_006743 [Perkinsus olseni]KAF4674747.1 hypothetical protein FOL46_004007 [Perkinsus olseni]